MNKTVKLIAVVGACALAIVGITLAVPYIKDCVDVEPKTEE